MKLMLKDTTAQTKNQLSGLVAGFFNAFFKLPNRQVSPTRQRKAIKPRGEAGTQTRIPQVIESAAKVKRL